MTSGQYSFCLLLNADWLIQISERLTVCKALDEVLVHHRVPSMKQLGALLIPLDEMLVHHRVTSMKQLGASLLTPRWDASPPQGTQHEVTRIITTHIPLDGMLVHHRVPSTKRLGALLLPLDGMLVHHRVPSMNRLRALLLPLDGMLVYNRVPSMKRLEHYCSRPGWDASLSRGT